MFSFIAGGIPGKTTSLDHLLLRDGGGSRHRSPDNGLGRREVLFQKHRRKREDVANVIEAVTSVVRGKLFFGVEINADQVANGISVLDPVKSSHGDSAGIEILGVSLEHRGFDPLNDLFLFGIGRARLLGGRHQTGPEVFEGLEPQVAMFEHVVVRLKCIKGDIALVRSVPVTVEAILLENGTNLGLKIRADRLPAEQTIAGVQVANKKRAARRQKRTRPRSRSGRQMAPSWDDLEPTY